MSGGAAASVVVFGDVIDDVIVTPVGDIRPDTDTMASIERRAGGSAANAAAWFAHLGRPTHFFGRVGADDVERHSGLLARSGVVPHLRGELSTPTGTIVVVLQPDRTRSMLTERGANALTGPGDVDRSLFAPGGHLHFTGYSVFAADAGSRAGAREGAGADAGAGPGSRGDASAGSPGAAFAGLIAEARAAGMSVSVNPGSAGFIADHGAESLLAATAGSTILIPNLDEGRALTGHDEPAGILNALLEHAEVVALTLGRGGVLAASRQHGPVAVPAVLVDPVDTTGAGDAFSAGFVTSLLDSGHAIGPDLDTATLAAACRSGVACAARAIRQVGARPPAPEH
ncbi:carbohydrate kinase family protein [Herbiconiux daphne]|uniref:carbohydrate kinase family protein n=1 Tax=Herbiconiux daphne TaxID=2970914 RepID=UPI0028780B44|nr:PfkB family carbohydrate kinase [Herbiconiux daphne]